MHNTLSLLVYVGSQTNEIERNVKLRGRMKQRKIALTDRIRRMEERVEKQEKEKRRNNIIIKNLRQMPKDENEKGNRTAVGYRKITINDKVYL